MNPVRRALRAAWYALRHEAEVTPDGTYIVFIEKGKHAMVKTASLDMTIDTPMPRLDYSTGDDLAYHPPSRSYGTFNGTIA